MIRHVLVFLCALSVLYPAHSAFAQQAAPSAQQAAPSTTTPPPLTIENIFAEGGITGRGPETVKWSPDATKVSFVQRDDSGEHGQLWYVDVTTGNKAVLVAESKLRSLAPPPSAITDERQKEWMERYSVAAYEWAPDSKHLLFDSRGQLWYYSLDSGTAVQLTSAPEPSSDPKFSPDGKRLAYIRHHDIWVRPVSQGEEKLITSSGDENLLNGEVDWVYAEELSVRSNYFWSPDGRQIVFLQMNESRVPTYPITDWMPTHPKVDEQKYPKAGDPNPEVRLGVVSSDGGKVRWLALGNEPDPEMLINRFGWVRNGLIYAMKFNRLQTKMEVWFVDTATGRSRLMLSESEPDAWIQANSMEMHMLKSGDRFTLLSWRSGYTQLYLYGFDKNNPLVSDAKLVTQLTKGEYEVDDVRGIDEAAKVVYYGANAGDPRQMQIFAVNLDGTGTRWITQDAGTHEAEFSPDGKYFVDTYSALMTEPRLSVCQAGGTCRIFWQARAVATYNLVPPRELELKAADGTTTLYAHLLLPAGADQAPAKKYPLILNPYGGPAGQQVSNEWGGSTFLFHQIMLRDAFAILQVDNRGMGHRGKQFAVALRHRLGKVEIEDQLAALDQVLVKYPMLDGDRLGFWGWSYGGFMTLYAMTHSDRFKAGVSVAPVTDWRNYDSIYTERFMGLPKENASGYADSSVVNFAKTLSGRLLEVHGTSDDNVHVQNTIQMVEQYIRAGKQFDLQLYPNKTHGISGAADRSHLFHRIQDQFRRWLLNPETK